MTTDGFIACASYTHARRHPMVLGKIGGWSPPVQLSIAQVAVLVSGYGVLLWSWRLWAVGPGSFNALFFAVAPWAPTWALRAVRIEGRDPVRTALGLLAYASSSRRGVCLGRPVPAQRRRRWGGRMLVSTGRG